MALALAGCGPVLEGPQLREVPPGLAYNTSVRSARTPLSGRTIARQVAYLTPGAQELTNTVTITEYEGEATAVEVASSREGYVSRYRRTRYGPIEPLAIAGRPGWAWTEAQDGDPALTLVGVVPLDGRTYGIELRIGRAEGRDLAAMKRMVSSFHVPRRRDPLPWGFLVFGAALLALTSFLARQNVAERQRQGRPAQG